jgi:hypothetical protein
MFLFAAPWYRSTTPWTISPISLTKSITPSCKTSVASVKRLISQKPKMAMHLWPGSRGSTSSPIRIFYAIIFEPASPKPIARSPPILLRVFWRTSVSRGALSYLTFLPWALAIYLSCSSCLTASSSACWAAWIGFFVISLTLTIMSSIGLSTKS